MVFPTIGSWFSNGQLLSGTSSMDFVATFTNGSSNVEYGLFDASLNPIIDFTQATNGSNTLTTTVYSGSTVKLGFRFIGYPGFGFNPKVTSFNITNLGAIAQTSNLGSDILLGTTDFTTANVNVFGSFTYLLTGSVSSTNGSYWTPIANFGQDVTITNAGSEPIIKFIDTTGSVVLDRVVAYFHTNDVN